MEATETGHIDTQHTPAEGVPQRIADPQHYALAIRSDTRNRCLATFDLSPLHGGTDAGAVMAQPGFGERGNFPRVFAMAEGAGDPVRVLIHGPGGADDYIHGLLLPRAYIASPLDQRDDVVTVPPDADEIATIVYEQWPRLVIDEVLGGAPGEGAPSC